MSRKKFIEEKQRLELEKQLIYLVEAERRLKLKNREFKKLYDENERLYEKHKLIWHMCDDRSISKSECNPQALHDLRIFYQNRMEMNDLIAMEFYYMGKKDAFHEFKGYEVL